MTAIEIINETVEFYTTLKNEKAINKKGFCVYEDSSGNKCAVGRCMIDTSKLIDLQGLGISRLISHCNKTDLDELLLEPYKGYPLDFWQDLQDFHDSSVYVKDFKLTDDGKEFVNLLKIKYAIEN